MTKSSVLSTSIPHFDGKFSRIDVRPVVSVQISIEATNEHSPLVVVVSGDWHTDSLTPNADRQSSAYESRLI